MCLAYAKPCQGQWDFTESQQENGSLCGGGLSGGASAWLAQTPFISLSGDAGESVTIRFAYSNSNPNGSNQFESSIDSPEDFNITLVANATIPNSGNLCVDTTLPLLEIGAIGVIYVAAVNPETGANVSSCATIEYIPESVEGQIVPDTNITYRDFYCSNSTDLPAAESSCDCHCHDADGEHRFQRDNPTDFFVLLISKSQSIALANVPMKRLMQPGTSARPTTSPTTQVLNAIAIVTAQKVCGLSHRVHRRC